MDFIKHVPHGYVLREAQVKVLQAIGQAWEKADNFVVHVPVGVGKSLIAMTISNAVFSSHILTPAKDLQTQYVETFGKDVALIAGRGNYDCCYKKPFRLPSMKKIIEQGRIPPRSPGFSPCSADDRVCKTASGKLDCMASGVDICPFDLAVQYAQQSPIAVHNMAGFCYHAEMSNKFLPRDVLIVDEAHSLEDVLRNVGVQEIELSKQEFEILEPKFEKEDFLPAPDLAEDLVAFKYERGLMDVAFPTYVLDKKYAELKRREHAKPARLLLTPKYTAALSQKHILNFGEKRVFMSGSIADYEYFTESLRLPSETTVKIEMTTSPFPVGSRLIIFPKNHLVDMNSKKRKDNEPLLDAAVRRILDRHPNEKGVIHTTSYAVSSELGYRLRDTGRMIAPKNGFEHKRMFDSFLNSGSNSVYISPSISEGVDLKYDRARFQIITTVSYLPPSYKNAFGEKPYIKRMNRQAMQTLMQQVGRVTRAADDHGVSYLIDSRGEDILSRDFPLWFKEAVRKVDI